MAALSYYVFSITIVCSIGFHSTFLNKATIAIGIYVAINKGKVKVYSKERYPHGLQQSCSGAPQQVPRQDRRAEPLRMQGPRCAVHRLYPRRGRAVPQDQGKPR